MTKMDQLQAELEALGSVEEKLRKALDFMKEALSQDGNPRFRQFWDTRKLCIPLFKEGVHPAVRSMLWDEMSELSTEARQLKEHLDQQSSFAAEQIELVIGAIEGELENQTPVEFDLPLPSKRLQARLDHYRPLQGELIRLNGWAARVNALRKELAATAMRLSDKNRLFKRLSALGDQIFPKRRELITQVSADYTADVDIFIGAHFKGGQIRGALHELRDEIKAYQAFAKALTLNTEGFVESRKKLSQCWDLVKGAERERRKEIGEQREAFKEQLQTLQTKLKEIEGTNLSAAQASRAIDEAGAPFKEMHLGSRERHQIRDLLSDAHAKVHEKVKAFEEKRKAEAQANYEALEVRLVQGADIEGLRKEIEEAKLIGDQRAYLRERLDELAEEAILALPEDERAGQLEAVLEARRARLSRIKENYDLVRKKAKSSGLDIGQAMRYNDLVKSEEERLRLARRAVEEVEKLK